MVGFIVGGNILNRCTGTIKESISCYRIIKFYQIQYNRSRKPLPHKQ